MKATLLLVLALIPWLGGCGREPQKLPTRDGWEVADYPPHGARRVGLFALQRASTTRLAGPWKDFYPALIIEPRDGVVPGAVRISSVASHVNATVGPLVMLDVSFDAGPVEPVAFVRGNVDMETTREFADRLQRHHTVTITLPGRGEHYPAGIVSYQLDGLGPQLAAIDAELHARREGAGWVVQLFGKWR